MQQVSRSVDLQGIDLLAVECEGQLNFCTLIQWYTVFHGCKLSNQYLVNKVQEYGKDTYVSNDTIRSEVVNRASRIE
jgi:hypothetical protein